MEKKLKASLEIVRVECNDIITSSSEHDNGYVDSGGFASLAEDIVNNVKKIF